MPRLFKLLIGGFLIYAIAAATPAQQADMMRGIEALAGAALAACPREDGLCRQGLGMLGAQVSGLLSDTPAPWLDDPAKRPNSDEATAPAS